ncbi:uncharacterized protein LAESUDRAFT_813465 [Laetiporus sulphureus 93-53]|uniref:MIF4G domain-containing protein n=1 Tax=Laetiporus sulphureus 93-53 TaxID=1314785 RepID=A0A165DPG4_9APHY|nr:uncharacterized protein LAESUDRAFT_813465 [Laetiporus sulphureus 93-53]KZT05331.1 hypothetical protein LAESUDRAFT_813465 [Laetiporus sulphureus 93-53]
MKEQATQSVPQDADELRARNWVPRNQGAAPTTIAAVHELAAKEKEREAQRSTSHSMSRGGSRRGGEREHPQVGPDGWSVAGTQKQSDKAADLSQFGEVSKTPASKMLTERINIMHERVKRLLANVENPEEEEVESLCKLLTTVGKLLDTPKARARMDVYFARMKELCKNPNVNSRMQFMLQDVIELRARNWVPRNQVAAPTTIAAVHELAAKEKEGEAQCGTTQSMSRDESRRGDERDDPRVGLDRSSVAATQKRSNKAGDLSHFGKISKTPSSMVLGPSSIFQKDKSKSGESTISRASSLNMLSKLIEDQFANFETVSSKSSRPPSRFAAVDGLAAKGTERDAQRSTTHSMSRGGCRLRVEREHPRVGLDRSSAAGTQKQSNKAGDLSHFGKIIKPPSSMVLGPSSIFQKDKSKSGESTISRASSSNMFSKLMENPELANEAVSSKSSRPPSRFAAIHELAAKEKEREAQCSTAHSTSRSESRRGDERDHPQVGLDGGSVAGTQKQSNKGGDLSHFGKISKTPSSMVLGPSSIFQRDKSKSRESTISRASSLNMFSKLMENPELANETVSSELSRPPSRKSSIDLGPGGVPEPAPQRRKLQLLPRSKPLADETKSTATPAESEAGGSDKERGEENVSSMSEAEAKTRVKEDSKEADAQLVADFFSRALSKNLCSPQAFEDGFAPAAEILDDIAIDAPKAFNLMAIMMKGAGLDKDEERRTRLASKSMDSDKLLGLLS